MTMDLPADYRWLAAEPGPLMLLEALKLFGTIEVASDADNPTILAWGRELGLTAVYTHDEIPWCGLFMAIIARRAGKALPADPLWALNWKGFGVIVEAPMLGDVMVKTRTGGGHVTLYVGEDDTHYHGLGGNQSDMVSIVRFPKAIPWAFRRPIYINQPANVRRVFLAPTGAVSTKES